MSPSPLSVLRTVKLRLDTSEVNFTARNVQYIKLRQNSRLRKILTMFRRFYNAYSCVLHRAIRYICPFYHDYKMMWWYYFMTIAPLRLTLLRKRRKLWESRNFGRKVDNFEIYMSVMDKLRSLEYFSVLFPRQDCGSQ